MTPIFIFVVYIQYYSIMNCISESFSHIFIYIISHRTFYIYKYTNVFY